MWPCAGTSMMIKAGWVCWVCFFFTTVSSVPDKIYKKVGDDVVLRPDSVYRAIASILWKHGPNIAMEWDGKDMDSYRQFKERGSLNRLNGEMTITGLTQDDGGLYTPEINNTVTRQILLIIISPVPKPTVIKSCEDEKSSCNLTCEGDATGAEPVTYRWKSGDKVLPYLLKEYRITKENSATINEFICVLENPVSQEISQPLPNPFITESERSEPQKLNISTGLTVFICLLAAVILLVLIHRWKAGSWFFQKESMPWEAGFWSKNHRPPRNNAGSNGTAGLQETEEAGEETQMA